MQISTFIKAFFSYQSLAKQKKSSEEQTKTYPFNLAHGRPGLLRKLQHSSYK